MTRTLLVVIGILCAVIGAVGVMHNSPNATRIQTMKQYNELLRDISAGKELIPGIREFHDSQNAIDDTIEMLSQYNIKESILAIRRLLKDEDMQIRAGAICALGAMHDRKSIPEIRKIMMTSDKSARFNSIWALAVLGDMESIPQIKGFLNGPSRWTRKVAEWALKKLGVTESEIEEAKKAKEGK